MHTDLVAPDIYLSWVFQREMLTTVFRGWMSLGPLRSRCQNKTGIQEIYWGKYLQRTKEEEDRRRQRPFRCRSDIWERSKGRKDWVGRSSDGNTAQVWENLNQITGARFSQSCPGVTLGKGRAMFSHCLGAAWWQHGLAVMDAAVCHLEVSVISALLKGDSHHRRYAQRAFFPKLFTAAKNVICLNGPLQGK